MIFSCGVFLIKKTPNLICFLFTLINIIMLFFVINGATHNSNAYSSLYLIEYRFNQTSEISTLIASQYSSQNDGDKIQDFAMEVGFMGVCLNFGGNATDRDGLTCGYTSDMYSEYHSDVPSFLLTSSTNNSSTAALQLFDIASRFQNKATKYRIFIVEIVFLLVLLILQLYNSIGFLPFQIYVRYLIIMVIFSTFIIICISITWLLVTVQSLESVAGAMTMNILSFKPGKKAQTILWVVFALLVLQISFYIWQIIAVGNLASRLGTSKDAPDVEKDAVSANNSVLSSIITLRETL